MKETSDDVAQIAAKGMTKPLTRAEQKSVCASCLGQREHALSMPKVKRKIARIKKMIPMLGDTYPIPGIFDKVRAELDSLRLMLTNDATDLK